MDALSRLSIEGHFDPATSTVSYIVLDTQHGRCALVDPVLDYDPKSGRTGTGSADRLISRIGELGAEVVWVLDDTVEDGTRKAAFVGDTLFMPDCGTARCDVPGGDARPRYRSINTVLSPPPDTCLYLCHDDQPGGREVRFTSTIAEQRAHNIHVRDGIGEDTFVSMRTTRDAKLGMPTLMLPTVQMNMRAGNLPEPEANGIRDQKIPPDRV